MSDDEMNETAAEDVKAEQAPDNEPSLDELLADFGLDSKSDEATNKQSETRSDVKDDLQDVVSYVRSEIETKQQERDSSDLASAVESVKGDLDIDPELVEGWLNARASKDKRLTQLWENRGSDPARWNKAVEALGRDFAKVMGSKPNSEISEDVEAVAAAVRGASTKNPEPTDDIPDNVEQMSGAEFEKWVKSLSK